METGTLAPLRKCHNWWTACIDDIPEALDVVLEDMFDQTSLTRLNRIEQHWPAHTHSHTHWMMSHRTFHSMLQATTFSSSDKRVWWVRLGSTYKYREYLLFYNWKAIFFSHGSSIVGRFESESPGGFAKPSISLSLSPSSCTSSLGASLWTVFKNFCSCWSHGQWCPALFPCLGVSFKGLKQTSPPLSSFL